ncbi:sugar O-acetyltransferase [Pontiellaceae bacterium B12227]|nr:sugar O-acetyltransferase [Pontiellaceae bacterium B12227]
MKSEKEKMLAGELYYSMGGELAEERAITRNLLKKLNVDLYGQPEEQGKILRDLLPNCADDIYVTAPFYCDYGYNIHCDEKVYLNFNCVFLDVCKITIGARTLFAPNVQLYTAGHPLSAKERAEELEFGKPITIGKDCWLGGNAIVLPGVTIGDRVVVGAGAVVTKDIPSDCVVAGNPARIVKTLDPADAP